MRWRRTTGGRAGRGRACLLVVSWVALLSSAGALRAQIVVPGLTDREVYTDRVSFRVEPVGGFEDEARLNGVVIATGAEVLVDRPDYYELDVTRRADGSVVDEVLVRFIVRASARGNSEWGLPPWVPLPPIPSADAEFAGGQLRIIAPSAVPAGVRIPIIALVEDGEGRRVGVNGSCELADGSAFPVFRGVGSVSLDPRAAPGTVVLDPRLGPVAATASVVVESDPAWIEVGGSVAADAAWADGSRVRVTSSLTVEPGVTLSVGADVVVVVEPDLDISVRGALTIAASRERPTLFTSRSGDEPWGGFILRDAAAVLEATGAILTGSGANPDWFDEVSGAGSSHRDEQALVYLSGGATGTLTDCWLIDNHGQAGHGEDSFLTLSSCLVQRCITVGQYNRGAVIVEDSALLEFPAWDAPFSDDDNDGLYLTGGAHRLERSLIGWALDDGVDAGSGSAGSVDVVECWFESCYHEGMAWSEERDAAVSDSVSINNGQGIECGFDNPTVLVERCLSTANVVGTRFGDNYDWDYEGFLTVLDSLILYNYRDTWGQAWDDWSHHLDQMDLRRNLVTIDDGFHPENALWSPADDAARLVPFLSTPATTVGVGLALGSRVIPSSVLADGVPVRLSSFTTHEVSVQWMLGVEDVILDEGTLVFEPGRTVRRIPIPPQLLDEATGLRVELVGAEGAEITGIATATVPVLRTLIARGATWRYSDGGTDEGTAWREPVFDDGAWGSGAAELGYGDGDEATEIDGGPSGARYPTVYFRHRFLVDDPARVVALTLGLVRDDGAVVYLNGVEVVRSNMPGGAILFETLADSTQSGGDEESLRIYPIDPARLVGGENVIAVEVHQVALDSSDVSFDLELVATLESGPPGVVELRRGDANGDGRRDVSDAIVVLFVLFLGEVTTCLDALDVDDSGLVDLTDAVGLLEYLFRGGSAPPPPLAACGVDPTEDGLDCVLFSGCP